MFQVKIVVKIKAHSLCSRTSFCKSYHLGGNTEKYGGARHTTDDNAMLHVHCMLDNLNPHAHVYAQCK